jgi:hypothetical protein
MSASLNSPVVDLGYLSPSSQVSQGSATRPLSPSLPRSLPTSSNRTWPAPRSSESPINFTVDETGLLQPSSENVLDSLAQINSRPKFESLGEVREDTVMERLLRNGYLVKSRIYSGQKIAYLLARTKVGDCVFIKIDDPKYRDTFPTVEMSGMDDIQTSPSAVTIIPQDTKMGAMECLEYEICGAAFICNGAVCMAENPHRVPEIKSYKEQTLIFNSGAAASLGNSVMAYPIVNLSSLLADPKGMTDRIAVASNKLLNLAGQKVQTGQEALVDSVEALNRKAVEIARFSQLTQAGLNRDIALEMEDYAKWGNVDPTQLSNENYERYDALLRSLAQKKELRAIAMARIGDAQALVKMINAVTQEIDSILNPIVDKVVQSVGNSEI